MCYKWLKRHYKGLMVLVTTIVSIGTLLSVCSQLNQSLEFKKYDNFKYFNKVYDAWYDDMPEAIIYHPKTPYDNLDASGQAWVRRYFNLYSQEFYLYKHEMLPKEMWEEFIHGCETPDKPRAAFLNFREYPALLQGYEEWKKGNAFAFPVEFKEMLDEELKKCETEWMLFHLNTTNIFFPKRLFA